jgi:PleD family two-component response regulator
MTETTGHRTPVILVVDDNMLHHLMARGVLEEAGFLVEEAADGEECLNAVEGLKPDLLLLDLNMPKLNGFDVCAELRRQPEFIDLPIVIVTGFDDDDSINRAFEEGATDFVTKPINWALFAHRIKYLMRASRTERELRRTKELLEASLNEQQNRQAG